MPELPEVETLRRSLEPTLVGRTVVGLDLRLPRIFLAAPGLGPDDLVGRRVLALRRRAKFLIVELSSPPPSPSPSSSAFLSLAPSPSSMERGSGGEEDSGPGGEDRPVALVFHLRLTGQLVQRRPDGTNLAAGGHPVPEFTAPLPHRSTHAIFHLDDGSLLYYTDIRQFGRIWLRPADAVAELIERARLGPEPLGAEFGVERFAAELRRHPKIGIKPLLLGQRLVGGLGNIYADESLHAAGLHPLRPAGSLAPAEVERLHGAIRAVLGRAVTEGVADIRNGRANPERDFPLVHGRAGQPCPRCGTTVEKTRVGGRGTYLCPTCQPAHERRSGS